MVSLSLSASLFVSTFFPVPTFIPASPSLSPSFIPFPFSMSLLSLSLSASSPVSARWAPSLSPPPQLAS